jgi:2-dehydro-3-deoxyphosphogluconate aldolase/(4S)-4-hydroxy-2-oxoglutarate aldolase
VGGLAAKPLQLGQVLPIVVIDAADDALQLADALIDGGVRAAEITLRTREAVRAISLLSSLPGFVVGAGTVLDESDAEKVIDAGASFVVSPGLDERVVHAALVRDVTVMPGVATASEIQRARLLGLRMLKLFPAEQLGGPAAIRAFAGPFPDVSFMPSGGVGPQNAAEYGAITAVATVSTSWVAPRSLIAEHDFTEITRRCAALVAAFGEGRSLAR